MNQQVEDRVFDIIFKRYEDLLKENIKLKEKLERLEANDENLIYDLDYINENVLKMCRFNNQELKDILNDKFDFNQKTDIDCKAYTQIVLNNLLTVVDANEDYEFNVNCNFKNHIEIIPIIWNYAKKHNVKAEFMIRRKDEVINYKNIHKAQLNSYLNEGIISSCLFLKN